METEAGSDQPSVPLITPSLVSLTGTTRSGEPLALNRAPAPDLAPWLARTYATKVSAPPDYSVDCSLLADTSVARVLLSGSWTARTKEGVKHYGSQPLFFGPQSTHMPVEVRGSFSTVGIALRPGTCAALGGPAMSETLDRILTFEEIGGASEPIMALFDPEAEPTDWLLAIEQRMRELVDRTKGREPDPVTTLFDQAAFDDPSIAVGDFARKHGIEVRRLERIVSRDFGMSPKQVLRRARALDMAAQLLGVADDEEAEEIALRYFDQAHLTREFLHFFGMTPGKLLRSPKPLLRLSLETRQARRLEELQRLGPGQARPWE